MALENANYIPELVETNPDGADLANTLDDHDRTIKRAVKGSFPNFVGTTATPKSVSLTEDQINDAARKGVSNTFTEAQTFQDGGNECLSVADPQGGAGVEVYGRTGIKRKVGFRNGRALGIPDADYTLSQDDEGEIKRRSHNNRVITVPQLEDDTEIGILVGNNSGNTLEAGTGVTLRWYNGLGSYQTGDRNIAGGSFIFLKWETATVVAVVGNGIT